MKSMLISRRLYSLQYVHTSHITGITIYCIHTRLTLPPPQFYLIDQSCHV